MWRWMLAGLVALGAAGCDLTDPDPDSDGGGFFGGFGGGGSGGEGGEGGMVMMGCASDDACPAGRPRCVIPEGEDVSRCVQCTESAQCGDAAPVCRANACVSVEGACREDFDCAVERPECLLLPSGGVGVCVECRGDGDCPGATPVCATTGGCVARGADASCGSDSACGPLRVCDDGACVEE